MRNERDANATLNFFSDTLMQNTNVQYAIVAKRVSMSGSYEWVVEIGVLNAANVNLGASLPIPNDDGTLTSRRIPLVIIQTDEISVIK